MIPIVEIYNDVVKDNVNESENGSFTYEMFNRLSKRAELRMLDFLSGDVSGMESPIPDLSQKNRDWLAPFVFPWKTNVSGGELERPNDYYGWDNAYLLGSFTKGVDCDDTDSVETVEGENTPITILSPQKFYHRSSTDIEELKPSFGKPIAKLVGKKIYFLPVDLGAICIEYIRYPKFGNIATKIDQTYNQEVPDEAATQNYEWDESARELLVWFITDMYSIHSREQSLKQNNQQTGKVVRDNKR